MLQYGAAHADFDGPGLAQVEAAAVALAGRTPPLLRAHGSLPAPRPSSRLCPLVPPI